MVDFGDFDIQNAKADVWIRLVAPDGRKKYFQYDNFILFGFRSGSQIQEGMNEIEFEFMGKANAAQMEAAVRALLEKA